MSYQIQCSTCGKKLLVREHSLGKRVRCSSCKTEFIAEAAPGEEVAEEPSRRGDDEGPDSRDRPRRQRDDDDRDRPESRRSQRRDRDEDEEDDRPRRRRRDEEDEEDEEPDRPRKRRRRQNADAALANPAFALQIVAYAGGGLSAISILMYLVGMLEMSDMHPGSHRAFHSAVGAAIAAVWVALVAKGAAAMANQQGYAMAITGCIVAMVPLTLGCLGGLPIGIWGLVILLREDIRQQFH